MVKTIQQRFTQGEFDPKVIARNDTEQYTGGAETMTNVVVLPQGGFKRRGGLEFIGSLLKQLTFESAPTISAPNGGTTANVNDRSTSTSFTTTTNISTTNPYVVVRYDLGSAKTIGVVHVLGLALSSGTSSQFFVQVSTDDITYTSVGSALSITTTAKNFSRRVNASYRYVRLARIGSTDLGAATATLTDFNVYTESSYGNCRLISFEFNSDQSYILVATDKNIAVYRDGVFQVDIPAPTITNSLLPDINWTQSADTLIVFQEDINPVVVQRRGADNYWTAANLAFESIPYFAFTETSQTGAALTLGTMTPSATTGTVTLTFSSGTLPTPLVNQYFEGNGGRARVLARPTATTATAYVEIPFFTTAAIANTDYVYLSGYEETWSTARGWPICGTFHSGRLWIGGSKSRPTTVWGSRSGLYYDFALGSQQDDDGIEATLDSDQLNRIVNMYSGRDLMIFTSGSEIVIPTPLNEPITPSNIQTSIQSRVGSERGFKVYEIEGGVFYYQAGGQSIQEFIFADTQQSYTNNFVSLLSGHLVKNPTDFALRRATSLDDGALLAIVRSDGNATIATIQRSQLITAFTDHSTDGTFKATGSDFNDLYFVVTRNSIDYLERINEDHYLDASVRTTTGLPATVFTGLSHLNGEECRVVADGSVLPRVTPSGGSATISRNAEDYCEIGLWFQPTVKDLPTIFSFANTGSTLGRLMNIAEVVLRLFETTNIRVNGKNIYFRSFGLAGGGSPLDAPPPQFTGIKRLMGFLGWDETAQVEITQDEPGNMTVLALSKRVNFGG